MLSRPSILLLALALAVGASAARAQDDTAPAADAALEVELNKLEDVENICRGYFIVRNRTGADLAALELDTFLFDGDGIILQRLALPFGAARSGRMRIVSFDLDLACADIGSLFVNDVLTCETSAPVDCAGILRATSRAGQGFD